MNGDPAITRMTQRVEQRDGGMGCRGGVFAAREVEDEPGPIPDGGHHPFVHGGQKFGKRDDAAARKSCAHGKSPER
jgi:hypothetical protein